MAPDAVDAANQGPSSDAEFTLIVDGAPAVEVGSYETLVPNAGAYWRSHGTQTTASRRMHDWAQGCAL